MYLIGFINNLFEGPSGLILLIVVLLLFGAKRIPELARSLGSALNEFNKAKDDVHRQITQAAETPAASVPAPVAPATPATPVPPVSEAPVGHIPPAQQEPPKA